jgi:predicted DNA binding CopG/RHH family protein
MNSEDRIPLTDPSQVPSGMGEEQAREFWSSHEITEEYLKKVGPVPQEDLPKFRPRTKPVSVRLDDNVLRRMKRLAETKNKGYQTLLKEFVSERLYEEEKREGIVSESVEYPTFSSQVENRERSLEEALRLFSSGPNEDNELTRHTRERFASLRSLSRDR